MPICGDLCQFRISFSGSQPIDPVLKKLKKKLKFRTLSIRPAAA